ncbi:MAG: hypothetical protein LBT43_19125 [Prevotella sp.]|jgi:hypothetical protein|nr:hypothetical protein [Prevotella sp.]
MDKETKINILIAALAHLIAQGRSGNEEYQNTPTLQFLSPCEAQFSVSPGQQLPMKIEMKGNPLFDMLRQVVDYHIYDERRCYFECLYEEDEQAAEAFDKQDIYDPDTVPGHIYHILRYCQDLISETE